MNTPVSVVIPTYNSMETLPRAVASVIAQTYNNIELIVVDDCSTDGTKAYLEEMEQVLASRFLRYKHFTLSKQSGSPVKPRNDGVLCADHDYIAFLDADDMWYPTKIEKQIKLMEDSGAILSYHDMFVQMNSTEYILWSDLSKCYAGNVFNKLIRKNFIPLSSVMMNCTEHTFLMNNILKVSHDWDLFLDMCDFGLFAYINLTLGKLFFHQGSVITDSKRRRLESRWVVQARKKRLGFFQYHSIMGYYHLAELFDKMPKSIQKLIRGVLQNVR